MKKFKVTSIIILILVSRVVYATPIESNAQLSVKAFNSPPAKVGVWYMTPDIRICEYAPVSIEEVTSATQWWIERGYDIERITHSGHRGGCLLGNPFGSILIELVGQSYRESAIAATYIRTDDNGQILWAKIRLRSDVPERVLEHEIGHALGWLHLSKRGHMMHPIHERGGWDDEWLVVSPP